MPLTNAEKQSRARKRAADKLARYEGALREIAGYDSFSQFQSVGGLAQLARTALGGGA